jgi:hypothetical protein
MIHTITGVRNMVNLPPGYAELARRRGWDTKRTSGHGEYLTVPEFAHRTGYPAAVIQHLIATHAVNTVILDGVTHIIDDQTR